MEKRTLGEYGENLASKFIKSKNYKLLERNFRYAGTEIDIIALNDDILVFIEVKTRSSKKFGHAFEAVDFNKRKNIINTSLNYILQNNFENFQVRYDIIEVYVNEKYINHIENAFDLD
ncbi:YraN family protein [Anaerosphaera multitolerans]|uniref:UPF0102 protein EF514_02945 n=1 Tax=Anaerosphaera multitolerans TaxID=2487351 RepID=A0A437S8L4_9FIRM|nr:YraN family protein [Anaerosphaera multitolerans]RVU55244.1 YraN family protein [Anaerosphaera multitolerans]